MATSAICKSFKLELMQGTHELDTDVLKVALYDNNSTMNADTTAYTTTNEVTGLNYTAGGLTLVQTIVANNSSYVLDFSDVIFEDVTVTARSALIYNSSKSNKAIAVIDFGSLYISENSDFSITWPAPTASNGIIVVT